MTSKEQIQQYKLENQKKKEYLRGYREAVGEAEKIEEELEELRSSKMFPSFSMDGMPHGSGGSDLSQYAAGVDELMSKLIYARYKRIELQTDITQSIESMESEKERQIIRLRYIHGMQIGDICVEMGYSWTQTNRIHRKALKNFIIKDRKEENECIKEQRPLDSVKTPH